MHVHVDVGTAETPPNWALTNHLFRPSIDASCAMLIDQLYVTDCSYGSRRKTKVFTIYVLLAKDL